MEGVARYKVKLAPHCKGWAAEYRAVKALLTPLLGENLLDIQHVGSTAIAGIDAKPILDVAVQVQSLASIDQDAMLRAGYDPCGESGVPGRFLFVRRGDGPLSLSLEHIHCYAAGHPAFDAHVAFRDYLNTHPQAAQQYCQLKRQLAAQYPDDRSRYTAGKADFIQAILKLAGQKAR